MGKLRGDGLTPKAIWHVVKAAAQRAGIKNLAPHDLRRTCARLCHLAGGELEQIQFLLGHASVQTTERYLGCKQRFNHAVNDNLGVEDFCRPSDSRRISQECEEGRDAAIRSHSAAVSPTALRKTMGPDRYLPFLPTILNWIQQTLE